MGGDITRDGTWWSAPNWLFDAVVRAALDVADSDEVRSQLTQLQQAGFRYLSLDNLDPDVAEGFRRVFEKVAAQMPGFVRLDNPTSWLWSNRKRSSFAKSSVRNRRVGPDDLLSIQRERMSGQGTRLYDYEADHGTTDFDYYDSSGRFYDQIGILVRRTTGGPGTYRSTSSTPSRRTTPRRPHRQRRSCSTSRGSVRGTSLRSPAG